MGSEAASVNSQQTNDLVTDVVLLILDNDNVCSGIVPSMLKTHNYEVQRFRNLHDAFREVDRKDKTPKVILTSIGISGLKGYSSLRRTGNEVIMPVVFFAEKDKEALLQSLEGLGVTVYHIKSVNMNDIEDIWQHILVHKQRKKTAINILETANNQADSTSTTGLPDIEQPKGSSGGSEVAKKARVVWTIELNNRFIEAYNYLGHQGATPCRILELMNDPRLTRFHIASHLQKYRTHLREMQEELNPRRSKFKYKVSDRYLDSVNHAQNFSMPLEPFIHGTNDNQYIPQQSQENLGASFNEYISHMENEELLALAQNLEIPSLNAASSSEVDIVDLSTGHKFNEIYSMLQKCVSGEPCSTSYAGFKISNEGELKWDESKSYTQPECQVANIELKLQPSSDHEQPKSGYDLVESPVTFYMESSFDIYELLDFDYNIH